jgi:hypothetical protein
MSLIIWLCSRTSGFPRHIRDLHSIYFAILMDLLSKHSPLREEDFLYEDLDLMRMLSWQLLEPLGPEMMIHWRRGG